jgi:hypothetical protein
MSPRGHRLTTYLVSIPRILLAEWNTHCVFARNSASSRAVPTKKMIERVQTDPFIPSKWGKNQKGMTAVEEIIGELAFECEREWLHARDNAVYQSQKLLELGVHKQLTNRLLEPFMWHELINTATEYSNFFNLRNHKEAHPDFQPIAAEMERLYRVNEPVHLGEGSWHAPFAKYDENLGSQMREITAGRCARLSYLTHDGAYDPPADIGVHDKLLSNGHMSPLEHAARPMDDREYEYFFKQPKFEWDRINQMFIHLSDPEGGLLYTHFCAKFQGWVQYRKEIPHEEDYLGYLKQREQQVKTQSDAE